MKQLRRKLGLISSALLMTSGIIAFMFAHVFANLAALSAGFIERNSAAVTVGWICIITGLVAYFLIRKTFPRTVTLRQLMLLVLAAGFLAWLGFSAIVFTMQDSLVFSPRGLSEERRAGIYQEYTAIEEILIPADDDTVLHGWFVSNATAPPAPLVVLFAGQGGEVSRYLDFAARLPCCAWAFVNYRGYGLSTGKPSDALLFADALSIYDYFANRADIDASKIFALGGSLGTGVATYLSAQRPLAGVILFSPYDRIGGGVAQDMIPFISTRLLITNRFDALMYAPATQATALAIVGEEDAVIRPERSQKLLQSWGQAHNVVTVPGGDHYSIYEDDAIWDAISTFIDEIIH